MIGKNIRKYRKKKGLTQDKLARMADIPYTTLNKIEVGVVKDPSISTVAKIANGIADTLLTNAAIMALKAFVPVYILPCDYKEGITVTQLPDGSDMKIRVRKEDAEYTRRLADMEDVFVLEKPEEIHGVFKKHFTQ